MNIEAGNTILYSRRFADCVAFYGELLGLEVSHRIDWFVEFRVTDSTFVSVADAARTTIDSAGGAGITLTFKVADADAVHRRLTDLGAVATAPSDHPWGARSFYVFDPEDRRIEFWSASTD